MILDDGTVVESGLMPAFGASAEIAQRSTIQLQAGQVVAIVPIDDKNSLSKKYTEYHVLVNEENTNILYKNVRVKDVFGGKNDFNEIGIPSGDKVDKVSLERPEKRVGAQVLLLCMYGRKDEAIIIGGLQHSGIRAKQDDSNADKTGVPELSGSSDSIDADMKALPTLLPGAKAEDGQRILGEFNGLRWNINKDGELTVMFQGVKNKDGKLTNNAGISVLKFNSSGEVIILDKEDQEIKISPADKMITIDSGSGHKIEIDKTNGVIRMGEEGDSFTVSEENLRNYIQNKMMLPYNVHTHIGNLGILTAPPSSPTMLMPPSPDAPGIITVLPAVDGTPTSEFAAKNTKVTKK
jgi:hypothetical protein